MRSFVIGVQPFVWGGCLAYVVHRCHPCTRVRGFSILWGGNNFYAAVLIFPNFARDGCDSLMLGLWKGIVIRGGVLVSKSVGWAEVWFQGVLVL